MYSETLIQALLSNQLAESVEHAKEIIDEMIYDIETGTDPEEVLYMYGLEPDYVFELL